MKERPDQLIVDTFIEVVEGRASKADIRAAIELCLPLPGWDDLAEQRAINEHVLVCDKCLDHAVGSARLERFFERMVSRGAKVQVIPLSALFGPDQAEPDDTCGDLATMPTKGTH